MTQVDRNHDLDAIVQLKKLMSKLKHQGKTLLVFLVQAHKDDKQRSDPLSNIGITNTHVVIVAGCGWEVHP
jgi:folylpolyglutamate synthase/dihydropteroate synthase